MAMHRTDPDHWKHDYATRLILHTDGRVEVPGVDFSGKLTVHFRTNHQKDYWNFIIVKVTGGTYWNGIGMDRAYEGAKFLVFRIHEARKVQSTEELRVERIVDFPVVAEADMQRRRENREARAEAERQSRIAESRRLSRKLRLS